MSDRKCVIDMETRPRIPPFQGADRITLYMDGESGTWRLFVDERGNSDFTLQALVEFRDRLNTVLTNIDRDPDSFNAEVRAAWAEDDK